MRFDDYDHKHREPAFFEVRFPANDNAGPKPKRVAGPSPYTAERIDLLLALAGYDPALIPANRRLAALHVAWCFEKKLYDVRSITRAVDHGRAAVERAIDDLRCAANAGTVVG